MDFYSLSFSLSPFFFLPSLSFPLVIPSFPDSLISFPSDSSSNLNNVIKIRKQLGISKKSVLFDFSSLLTFRLPLHPSNFTTSSIHPFSPLFFSFSSAPHPSNSFCFFYSSFSFSFRIPIPK